jgi:hypothetical protein
VEYWSYRLTIVSAVLIFAASPGLSAQTKHQEVLAAGKIDVRVLHAIHEAEESTVSYVTVLVTVRSGGVSFVVPTCSGYEREPVFCMASLRRSNGTAVPVRKGLAATLGLEDAKSWNPTRVPANGETDLQFSIDMGLLDVRPGEAVRVAFWIWTDGESMKDPKRGKMVLSPMFRIPVKPE